MHTPELNRFAKLGDARREAPRVSGATPLRGGFALSIVVLLLAATPALADSDSPAPTWSARGGINQRWLTSQSAVTLTESNLVGWDLAAERRLLSIGLPGPFPVLDVTTELGFSRGSVDGTTFDQLDNHISTWQLTAGARARLPILSWLHLQARAAVGGGKTKVRIADGSMSSNAIADGGAMSVAATGLGLALLPRMTSRGSSTRFFWGIEAEVGYQTTTATSVRAYPEDRPAPDLTIPAQYASLGDVDLDGWTLTIGMVMGF